MPIFELRHTGGAVGRAAPGDGAIATFPGEYLFTEVEADVETMFPAATLARLREVKAKYDPWNVIRANHEVTAAQ